MVLPGLLEAIAIVITVTAVFLAVKRSIWQYPFGLVGVVLFAKVFIDFGLYSSAALQVFFFAVQLYGWWFWLYGDNGKAPRITRTSPRMVIGVVAFTAVFALLTGVITSALGAAVAFWDALILSASLGAQFLLDRKKIETWIAWAVVNVVSIPVYFSQGLEFTAYLYMGLLINTFVGYYFWHRELKSYPVYKAFDPGVVTVWEKGTSF